VPAAVSVPVPAAAEPAPVAPAGAPSVPVAATPPLIDQNAAAAAALADGSASVRFTPTRPGTPVAGALQSEKVADVTPATTYVVRPGDSLWSIAKKHKLTVGDLTAANGIAANANLQPGKKLVIPAKSGAVAAPAAAPAPAPAKSSRPAKAASPKPGLEGVRHVVKSGESLSVIARNYGVRQSEIALANGISDPTRLQAGTEIVIPGVSAPKAPKAAEAKAAEPAVPAAPPVIPVIRIEESPVTPAPKP
jgi:LysM repeat protein